MLAGYDASRPLPSWTSTGKRRDCKITWDELERARERMASRERRMKT